MHFNAKDLSGLKIGFLMVIKPTGKTRDNHVAWLCKCECGKEKIISSNTLTRKRPAIKSCGCVNKIVAQKKIAGAWNEGKSYTILQGEHCYKTRHGWAKAAIKHYGNKCEKCGWDRARCDAHHRILKSKGGLHTIKNAIVLCPNCHRIEHERGYAD